MRSSFLFLLFSAAVLLLSISALPQSDRSADGFNKSQEVVVQGMVVDHGGKPVSGAFVRLYWQCRSCPDQLFPGQHTLIQGSFRLIADKGSLPMTIFIDDYLPKDYWAPLFYLPDEKRASISSLRGVTLKGSRSSFRLGAVKIPYRYGFIEIDPTPNHGDRSDNTTYSDLSLEIFDGRGNQVDDGVLPRSVLVDGGGKLKIALPVSGSVSTWRLRLTQENKNVRSVIFDHAVELKQLECKAVSQLADRINEMPCHKDSKIESSN